MYPPEGFNYGNKLCKLTKSLYGLKQASVNWNERFARFLKQNDLEQLKTDQCIFKHKKGSLVLAIYVDDGIVIGKSMKEINKLVRNLENEFEMKVENSPKTFLGMEIEKTETKLKLSQRTFATKLLKIRHGKRERRQYSSN